MKKTIWARILASFAASTCLSFAARLDNSMDSALFDAIHQGNVASVRKLLLQGANPNAKDAEGTPALMQCAVYSNVECMKALLDRGADPNARNAAGATAIIWAGGDPAKVKLLLARNADVNARSGPGRTALLVAASHDASYESVRALINAGADTRTKDNLTGPPILFTAGGGALASIKAAKARDPGLQHERALAYQRIGDVLGLPSTPNLGRTSQAISSYRKALEIQGSLAQANPNDTEAQTNLALINDRLCIIQQSAGGFRTALETCHAAVDIRQKISDQHPDNPTLRAQLAASYQNLSSSYFSVGDWGHTEKFRSMALSAFEQLHKADPANREYQRGLALACLRMAGLEEHLKNYPSAQRYAQRSVDLYEDLNARAPQGTAPVDGTFALQRLGSVRLSINDLPGALKAFSKALALRQEIVSTDPDDVRARLNLANSHAANGVTLLKLRKAPEALRQFESQRDLVEELMISDKVRIEYPVSLSEAHENIGMVSMLNAELAPGRVEKIRHLRTARKELAKAMEYYDALQSRHAVSAEYAAVPDRIRREISECDHLVEKLASLTRTSG